MNSKYKVLKYRFNNTNELEDLISIEEPLEITIKFKNKETWIENTISVTMRTPGNDEDLVRGFLYNERIIEKIEYIDKIKSVGEKVGKYNLKNKIIATINNSENVDIDKIKRNFLTNSSCGVCGKTSLDSLEIIKKDKIIKSLPKINHEIIIEMMTNNQTVYAYHLDVSKRSQVDVLVGDIINRFGKIDFLLHGKH